MAIILSYYSSGGTDLKGRKEGGREGEKKRWERKGCEDPWTVHPGGMPQLRAGGPYLGPYLGSPSFLVIIDVITGGVINVTDLAMGTKGVP